MASEVDRLRAVLAAAGGAEALDVSAYYGPSDARSPALATVSRVLPALLAVVEAAAEVADHRRRCSTGDVEPYEGDRVHSRLAIRLDALDAAIAAALPEEP